VVKRRHSLSWLENSLVAGGTSTRGWRLVSFWYHRNYIGQLERGEKSPSLTALFDFAKTFGMRPSEVLKHVEGRLSRDH
jgi:transcriptional regulator with XRE-family HTH domain